MARFALRLGISRSTRFAAFRISEQLVVIFATAMLCALLYAMFRFSRIGVAMQAASQNQLAAWYMGIPD